jgi:hypothetical protein
MKLHKIVINYDDLKSIKHAERLKLIYENKNLIYYYTNQLSSNVFEMVFINKLKE